MGTSCSWLPDGRHLISGGLDKSMYMWDTETGQEVAAFKGSGARINDIAVSRCGRWVFSSSNEKKFRVHPLQGRRLKKEREFVESESILSICLSACNRYLLVNLQNQNIHLWDFSQMNEGEFPVTPMSRYSGQLERQGRYVVRSCFGGSDFTFVERQRGLEGLHLAALERAAAEGPPRALGHGERRELEPQLAVRLRLRQ